MAGKGGAFYRGRTKRRILDQQMVNAIRELCYGLDPIPGTATDDALGTLRLPVSWRNLTGQVLAHRPGGGG